MQTSSQEYTCQTRAKLAKNQPKDFWNYQQQVASSEYPKKGTEIKNHPLTTIKRYYYYQYVLVVVLGREWCNFLYYSIYKIIHIGQGCRDWIRWDFFHLLLRTAKAALAVQTHYNIWFLKRSMKNNSRLKLYLTLRHNITRHDTTHLLYLFTLLTLHAHSYCEGLTLRRGACELA